MRHRAPGIAGLLALAAAQDNAQARGKRRFHLGFDHSVAFAVIGAALAVAKDHEFRARIRNHRGRDITRMRAAIGKVTVLRADANLLGFAVDWVDKRVRRRDRHLDFHVSLGRAVDRARFGKHGARSMHFPVSNDIGPFSHQFFLRER